MTERTYIVNESMIESTKREHFDEGYKAGKIDGYESGKVDGYQDGYSAGYKAAIMDTEDALYKMTIKHVQKVRRQ